MITKQGNALLRTGFKAIKNLGSSFLKRGPKPGPTALKPNSPTSFFQEYKNQALNPLSLGLDAMSLFSGGSLGASVFGNIGGVAATRMMKPLTNRISRPWLRKTVSGAGMLAGDMAASTAADTIAPIWRRKPQIPQQWAGQQPQSSFVTV